MCHCRERSCRLGSAWLCDSNLEKVSNCRKQSVSVVEAVVSRKGVLAWAIDSGRCVNFSLSTHNEEKFLYYLICSLAAYHLGRRWEVAGILTRHHFLHILFQPAAVSHI